MEIQGMMELVEAVESLWVIGIILQVQLFLLTIAIIQLCILTVIAIRK